MRDEDAKQHEEGHPFLAEQSRCRQIVIGNCRLLDPKLEKNGAFEFIQKVSILIYFTKFIFDLFCLLIVQSQDTYFECDNLKGAVNGGQE